MTKQHPWAISALLMWAIATGCGGGGSGGGAGKGALPKGALPGILTVQTQWPADQETQIPTDATVAVRFDGPLIAATLEDGRTFLEEQRTGKRVDSQLSVAQDGHTLQIRPTRRLANETWYVVHLSPLLADRTERLLEEDRWFAFQTQDVTAPRLVQSSVAPDATGVAPDVAMRLRFDEPIDPQSIGAAAVRLLDPNGAEHAIERRGAGTTVHVEPIRDLQPATRYTLRITGGASGLRDRAGNPLAAAIAIPFTTRDEAAPRILDIDPAGGEVSPHAQVFLTFDSSMDPGSLHPGTVRFTDGGRPVPFTVHPDPSHRVMRLLPNQPLGSGRSYTVQVAGDEDSGPSTPRGSGLANSLQATFRVGTDATPPRLQRAVPGDGANRVAVSVVVTFDFDEQVDPARLNSDTIRLADSSGPLPFVVGTGANSARVTLTPSAPLQPGEKYTVTLTGGPFGLRDLSGNTLATDLVTSFSTTTDATPPRAITSPTHGHSAVSKASVLSMAFEEPLDPDTVNGTTVLVTDDANRPVAGALELTGADRIVRFTPANPFSAGGWHRLTVRSGPEGVRETTGNWLPRPLTTAFRVAYAEDTTPPEVRVTLNGIADRRKGGLSVPPAGFEITVLADDPINYDVDLASFEVEITGDGVPVTGAEILGQARITKQGLSYLVPSTREFPTGEYTLRARVRDMAGNQGFSESLTFTVVTTDAATLPFERTQVVWVRFDLDRDHNGRADFVDDLYRLGLQTKGDPAGTNQRMADIMREGILSLTHDIFERKLNGGRKASGSIPVLFTATQPRGVTYAELAFGGLDPTAPPNRVYGAKSSGILGRAYFDHLNASRDEKNTATNPGLGVFGGELFLFEAETHITLYPLFVTTFAKRFMKVVPEMGGTAVGSHGLDRTVLDPDFEVNAAPPAEMRRYFDIFLAADDWAAAMAVVLAHETGHTIGLVGAGAPPAGQHGDASLHNRYPSLGDVMSAAVGYESLVSLRYRFRDLNAAYLRQRVLLK